MPTISLELADFIVYQEAHPLCFGLQHNMITKQKSYIKS